MKQPHKSLDDWGRAKAKGRYAAGSATPMNKLEGAKASVMRKRAGLAKTPKGSK